MMDMDDEDISDNEGVGRKKQKKHAQKKRKTAKTVTPKKVAEEGKSADVSPASEKLPGTSQ